MPNMKSLVTIIVFSATLSYVFGQSITINNVNEAIDLALQRNLDFQNYLINQEKAELAYKQAKSHRLPTITGSFSGQRNLDLAVTPLPAEIFGGEPGTTIDTQFGQDYNYNAGITIYKEIYNRESQLNAKVARLSLQMESTSIAMFEELLREQVSLYYYKALIANRAIAIGEEDTESAKHVYALTSEKYEQGLVDIITLNTAKINLNTVKQNLNSNKQMKLQSEIELKKLFGMNPQDSLLLTSSFEYYLPEVYHVNQLNDNILVKNADLQLKQADAFVKINQSSLTPTLSLNSYKGKQQFRNDFGLSFDSNSWSDYSYLTLNLSVPLFSGFNNRRNIKKSKFDQKVAYNEKLTTERNALLDDQRLIVDYNLSLEDATFNKEIYQLYQENQLLTYQKYEEGLISLDSYLRVFEDYLKAENAYLNSMSKVYSYYSQILPRI